MEVEMRGSVIEQSFFSIIGQRFFQNPVDDRRFGFSAFDPNRLSSRIDKKQRGPCVDTNASPDLEFWVVDDGVLDLMPQNRIFDVVHIFLGFEFGRVDSDDHQFVRIFLLKLLQLRKDVHAVDAAIRPKVHQNKFAA